MILISAIVSIATFALMGSFEQLRIVFFGTPKFAVATLDAIIAAGGQVVGVVTAPDKPAGRGKQLQQSAVKEYALKHELHLLQPEKMKDPVFLEQLRSLHADLQVVVAFRMMPAEVWDMPKLGTYNVHASLLPQYRGAAPINRAIMNGETATGVTTFKLKHEIDTGDIMLQQQVAILPEDNAGTLHDKLMDAGAQLMVTTLKGIAEGSIREQPQLIPTDIALKPAPKIFKDDMLIDWNRTAQQVCDQIRGLSPYPAAYTQLNDKTIKIFSCKVQIGDTEQPAGGHDTDGKSYLRFAAKNGWVYLHNVQLEGKKPMDVISFLRGFRQ